jgi:cytochrome bd-type quinol oxidase subunit 2
MLSDRSGRLARSGLSLCRHESPHVWQAASSAEALEVILVGAAVAAPAIAGYTVFAYRVFRGKASALTYG